MFAKHGNKVENMVKKMSDNGDKNQKNERTVDEARKLVEAGFEFVCDMEGCKLFGKPK